MAKEKQIGRAKKAEAKSKAPPATKAIGRAAGPVPTNAKVCIVCHRQMDGYAVRDDHIIRAIRAVKKMMGASTNNRLVVCRDCVETHKAKRASFEKKLMLYGGAGALIVIVFTLLSQSLQGFFASLMLGIFVAGLALFSYHPGSEAK